MKPSTENWLRSIVIFLIMVGFVVLFMITVNSQIQKTKNDCKMMGDKTGLSFYDYTLCKDTQECSYVCKFINDKGEIVLKLIK